MLTALDTDDSALDEHERDFVAKIREHGWFRTSVLAEGEEAAFSYTTGLWTTLGHPEVIVFGLKSDTAHSVLWDIFRDVKDGKALSAGMRLPDVFGNTDAYLFKVATTHYPEYLGWNRWFYRGDDFPCLQLVWPDRNKVFPWQDGFQGEFRGVQPDLSVQGWGEGKP